MGIIEHIVSGFWLSETTNYFDLLVEGIFLKLILKRMVNYPATLSSVHYHGQ